VTSPPQKKTLYEFPYWNKMLLRLGQDVLTVFILCVKHSVRILLLYFGPTPPLPPCPPRPPRTRERCVCRSAECHACLHSKGRCVLFRQSAECHTHLPSFQNKKKRGAGGDVSCFMLVKACSVRSSLIFQPTPSGL